MYVTTRGLFSTRQVTRYLIQSNIMNRVSILFWNENLNDKELITLLRTGCGLAVIINAALAIEFLPPWPWARDQTDICTY